MNLRDMLNMVRGGQDDRICVIKGTVSINDEGINKILYDGKYWIRVKGTGEIIPPIPEELMNAEAGMGLGMLSFTSTLTLTRNRLVFPKRAMTISFRFCVC